MQQTADWFPRGNPFAFTPSFSHASIDNAWTRGESRQEPKPSESVQIYRITPDILRLTPAERIMPPVVHSKEGEEPHQEALIARLWRFVEHSDLTFYQIASRIGTSGTMLSMWLAGTASPGAAESIKIDRALKD